ncbi:lipoate--protein ligase family protein [bacterium]|nr:lipoate--protein ligase family protein [bacterium]
MKVIPFEVNSGIENMQIDRSLLETAIRRQQREHVFRLYGWSPRCVSLGRNQKADFVDLAFLKQHKIDLVKRLTGGRALMHDKELTYCYICPIDSLKNGDSIMASYREILQIFIEPFKMLGIDLEISDEKKYSNMDINYCMQISTSADICYKGKKLIGSAQYRKEGYILQHGSILFDYNKALLEKIFKEPINTDVITCMKEINPDISIFDLIHIWDNK